MSRLFRILLFAFVPVTTFSQVSVKGNVADAGSGRCIPFAAIGIPGKDHGTISKETGSFEFEIPQGYAKEKVMIYAAGYKPKLITADSLKSAKFTVGLTPFKQSPSAVKPHGNRKEIFGNLVDKHDLHRAVVISKPGSEEATRIQNSDTLRLLSFNLRIDSLTYDSLLLRINLYHEKKGMPAEKINQADHYFQLQKTSDEVIKVLLNENIVVMSDFFASIEFIQGDGSDRRFTIYTFDDKKLTALKRDVSLGSWKTVNTAAPGFWFEAIR